MEIQVVNREEEILDPNMPIVDKIGTMARLCYRVEKDTGHETNVRIIGNCIQSGHESILEHGVISLVIDDKENEDSKRFAQYTTENVPVPFYRLWMSRGTDSMSKYMEKFMDIDIYTKFCDRIGKNDQKRLTEVLAADVRAWRKIINEKIYIASQEGDLLTLILLVKVVKELSAVDKGEILFKDQIA